jgi:DNA segregation ATPase FtsK/SpoIIIE, S-DNA-T family
VVLAGSVGTTTADNGPPALGRRHGGPLLIDVLAAAVTFAPSGVVTADGETQLALGVDFESLAEALLAIPDGEHVLVAGPARSGRTTALRALLASWRVAHHDGAAWVVAPRRSGTWDGGDVVDLDVALDGVARLDEDRPGLLVLDDAERLDDPRLGVLAAERRSGLLVAAAGRPDALRTLYGHWTTVVRRSRLGILLAACVDVDGDLLGELLPRRPPIPARPGLAWLVDARGRRLVQLSQP